MAYHIGDMERSREKAIIKRYVRQCVNACVERKTIVFFFCGVWHASFLPEIARESMFGMRQVLYACKTLDVKNISLSNCLCAALRLSS